MGRVGNTLLFCCDPLFLPPFCEISREVFFAVRAKPEGVPSEGIVRDPALMVNEFLKGRYRLDPSPFGPSSNASVWEVFVSEAILFHGHQVESIRTVIMEYLEVAHSPITSVGKYLGFDYTTLTDRLTSYFTALPKKEFEDQYFEICLLCQEYIADIERDKDAGSKARTILNHLIHPFFRANANPKVLREACKCYLQLNATRYYVADELRELLTSHSKLIIDRDLISNSEIDKVIKDFAYSDDERKRRHAITLISAFYATSKEKRAFEDALSVLAQDTSVGVQAKKAQADLGILSRQKSRRMIVTTLQIVGGLIAFGAAIVTIIEFVKK